MSPMDKLFEAIQSILNEAGDGWTLGHFACVTGIERLVDGVVESTVWTIIPADQPTWMTGGLLGTALDIQDTADIEDD